MNFHKLDPSTLPSSLAAEGGLVEATTTLKHSPAK